MLGYWLAHSGRRVLFVEKGRSTLPGAPDDPLECRWRDPRPACATSSTLAPPPAARRRDRRRRPGRRHAVHRQRHRRLLGAVRHGLQRFFVDDFTRKNFRDPRQFHRAGHLADRLEQISPWYTEAGEAPWGPRPTRSATAGGRRRRFTCGAAVSPDNLPLVDHLTGLGLHPYHLPMACDCADGCVTCEAYLCDKSCKNDAGRGPRCSTGRHRARRPVAGRVPGTAPGSRPHPGAAGDRPASLRHADPAGQGGGAGRRRAGHPGAVLQFPLQ